MQPETKTLIILSPGFPANEADSTCLPAQQQFVLALRQNFPNINIVVLAFQYPFFQSTYQWNGITVVSFSGNNEGKQQRLLLWLKIWRKLTQLRRQHRMLGLLSFWYGECALIAKTFGLRHKLPCFTWILGQDAREGNKYVKWARLKEPQLIALSDFIADTFQRNYRLRPQHVIPLGLQPGIFPPSSGRKIVDVMGAGSLIPLKQYNVFIDIVHKAVQTFPELRAVICGKGPEQESLQMQAANLYLQQNISVQGEIPYKDVLKLMQRSKIFLHPSSYEGFGMVCLEALYAGAHVISFCRPLNREIQHWHVVKSNEEMLQKLLQLLDDPELDHTPVLPFSMHDTAKAIMNLFDQ